MQNQQKKSLPPFKAVSSTPMVFLNFIFGMFWLFFALFFLAGMIFLLMSSPEEMGLDVIALVTLFFIFLIALSGIVVFVLYSRKKMYTTIVIDEKGIHYFNKFNNKVVKELTWKNFAKKEEFDYAFGSPQYDVNSRTPYKSLFDQFSWPVLVDEKVVIHIDAFLGKHPFAMFYSNRTELIRTFLLGISYNRQDITIDPAIFANHYINPENFSIDFKRRNHIRLFAFLFVLIILVGSYLLVFL